MDVQIQAQPSPVVWVTTGPVVPYVLTDESGVILTDESGTRINAE